MDQQACRQLSADMAHGARVVLRYMEGQADNFIYWAQQLAERKHPQLGDEVIALANKTARIVLSITCHESAYNPDRVA